MRARANWLLALGLVAAISPAAVAGTTYNFVFDNNGLSGPPASPPLVGAGTLMLGVDPGFGVFSLDSLNGFTMSFNVGGDVYTEADIQTTIATVTVELTDLGDGVTGIDFSNKNPFGDGPNYGAIDFQNSLGEQLSFSPPGSGANYLFYETGQGFFGNYLALAVPEPATIRFGVMGVAFFGLLWVKQTRKILRRRSLGI